MGKIIELIDVTRRFGDDVILSGINFTVEAGEFLAISGPNGAGKTTLLRLMLKLLKPSDGEVVYFSSDGSPVKHFPIGYLPQKNSIDLRFPISVKEVVLSGLIRGWGLKRNRDAKANLDELSTLLGLGDFLHKPVGSLSGGQLQRTLLARALISRPSVVVLDEPLSYVDKHFEHKIYDIMRSIASHATIILVSHEMTEISAMATRHIIVDHGITLCHAHHHHPPLECCSDPDCTYT